MPAIILALGKLMGSWIWVNLGYITREEVRHGGIHLYSQLKRLRQEDRKFKASLGNLATLTPN